MGSSVAAETKCILTGLLTSTPLRCTIQQLCNDFANTVGYKIPIRQLGFNSVEDYLRSIPDTIVVYGSGSLAEVEGIIKPKSAHINEMVSKQKKNSIPDHKKKYIKKYPRMQQSASSGYHSPPRSLTQVQLNLNDKCSTQSEVVGKFVDNECTGSLNSKFHTPNGISSSIRCKAKSKIAPEIQNNLRKFILRFPDGICCTKLSTEYSKMFKQQLCYEKFGYRSLIEMCSDLPEIFHFTQITSDDFILFDKSKPIPSLNQNDKIPNKHKMSLINWNVGPSLIPSDVLYLGDQIPRRLPDEFVEGDLLCVCIGEIYSISNFWIYRVVREFKTLMKEMQNFFHIERNKYSISELLLEQGLYCTCLYAEEFHRVVVVDLLPKLPGFVRVFFIDYGTVGNVRSNQLWYLPKKFGKMSSQGVRAKLWNICCPNKTNSWSIESTNKFKELLTNKELAAEVMKIDRKENVLEIYLADVTDENSIFYINDVFVTQGYGRYIQKIT